ncbi:hypothetical protein GBA52_014866 [Prunus armeniaca]|nr:hypothetical protein GBA52_014866 [Prunus armeniaca]
MRPRCFLQRPGTSQKVGLGIDSHSRFLEVNVHVMDASQGKKLTRLMTIQNFPKREKIKQP